MNDAKKSEIIPEIIPEIKSLAVGRIFRASPDEMSLQEQVVVHVLLKFLEEQVKGRQKAIREPLLAIAETRGTATETGKSKRLEVEGSGVVCEFRGASLPEEKAFRELLTQKGIALEDAFSEVKRLELDSSKIEYLIQTGKLTTEEVNALKATSKALRVYPSRQLEETVERLERLASGQTLLEESFELPEPRRGGSKRK